jgi:hypothetical protein
MRILTTSIPAWFDFIVRNATPDVFRKDIEKQYQQLVGVDFELLKTTGGGTRAPLSPLVREVRIPHMDQILPLRPGIIYIRPFIKLAEVCILNNTLVKKSE